MKRWFLSLSFLTLMLTLCAGTVVGEAESDSVVRNGEITLDAEYDRNVIDPENPTDTVDPGETEQVGDLLRIDFVPELRFGTQTISKDEATYYAFSQNFYSDTPARANYVQVSDYRGGGGKGWSLYLKQEYQFRSTTDQNIELLGANLFFDKSWASSIYDSPAPTVSTDIIKVNPGESYLVANAAVGTGEGKWAISFGASSSDITNVGNTLVKTDLTDSVYNDNPVYLNEAAGLIVPQTANVQPAAYTTVLTWTLSELP